MTEETSQLLQAALRLPESERADLAVKLIESLDPPSGDDGEAVWSQEILQRIEELRTGQLKAVPWSEARRQILEEDDAPGIA